MCGLNVFRHAKDPSSICVFSSCPLIFSSLLTFYPFSFFLSFVLSSALVCTLLLFCFICFYQSTLLSLLLSSPSFPLPTFGLLSSILSYLHLYVLLFSPLVFCSIFCFFEYHLIPTSFFLSVSSPGLFSSLVFHLFASSLLLADHLSSCCVLFYLLKSKLVSCPPIFFSFFPFSFHWSPVSLCLFIVSSSFLSCFFPLPAHLPHGAPPLFASSLFFSSSHTFCRVPHPRLYCCVVYTFLPFSPFFTPSFVQPPLVSFSRNVSHLLLVSSMISPTPISHLFL